MKRREFITGAAAVAALVKSNRAYARQADVQQAENTMTEPRSKQATARIPRFTNPGTMKGEMLYRELGSPKVQELAPQLE
jgi:hypothetical protein